MLVRKFSTRSTRFTYFCTALTSNFQQKILPTFCYFKSKHDFFRATRLKYNLGTKRKEMIFETIKFIFQQICHLFLNWLCCTGVPLCLLDKWVHREPFCERALPSTWPPYFHFSFQSLGPPCRRWRHFSTRSKAFFGPYSNFDNRH